MHIAAAILSVLLMLAVLTDAFEAIVLPRRVTRRFRLSRAFFRWFWPIWAFVARRLKNRKRRDAFLSVFGPLSLLMLLALWALGLIFAFGVLQWACGSMIAAPEREPGLLSDIYLSGTTFFTLGYGDVVPRSSLARAVAVAEAGMGFGFLAVVIGYLPVIYSAFSRRETAITLLDSRAGSPSSAVELLRRFAKRGQLAALDSFFSEWERWAAEVLESHLSYPVLSYYRSQHDNQSWLASITTILDACSLVMAGIAHVSCYQAGLTFAIARHAVVDLCQIFHAHPVLLVAPRLTEAALLETRRILEEAGAPVRWCDDSALELARLRDLYEPYVTALSERFLLPLPSWLPREHQLANWQTSAWGRVTGGAGVVDDIH